MTIYCIDTSALIAAWQERYPPENFPRFWGLMDSLIEDGRLVAPTEVLTETAKRSDELHKWLAERKYMFRELEDEIQIAAAGVLAQFPRLVGERKLRTSADPFVIALGQVESLQIVTDEKPTGSAQRPNIPDVVTALGLPPCMGLLELIRAEKWIVG
ncbi:DUF4411 family protein [Methylocystis sp.]|uniref:DUF4411 family protein n=1 Tax=Methylocystis sp. TaxID=1911079 RepID=UPI0025FAC96E|nr:DUF4411 family protein [Methylocystis sp.]